ncbi:hypothetical protein ABT272_44985 [Streptomyces sp900105245]|uniref:Uncharacterized protein n=1 Tax=Streptomyces sp. 900105245 TaxID=3154379 RepID=A0ABV1UM64_9ACTN
MSAALLAGGTATLPFVAHGSPDRTRIILDADTLSSLRQRATNGDPGWIALKKKCDQYLTGTVEWPDGKDYPNGGSIGEGYQGSSYFDAIANLGICYQVARGTSQSTAAGYGAKGVDLLVHMSAPASAPHAAPVDRDHVYGIRFYGLGMALGYDWLRNALTEAQRTRVYTAIDRWVDTYEATGFENHDPNGNYFAGYYATKAVAALATEGDNPRAATQWKDFLDRVHGKMVQPFYAANLSGGGWPDGQNYGPVATFNMILPTVAAKTAKNVDLVRADRPYTFPSGTAKWYMYNLWPNLKEADDRGTMRNYGDPAPASPKIISAVAGMMRYWHDPRAAAFHTFANDVRAANADKINSPDSLWSNFVFWDPSAPKAPYTSMPLGYYARGMEMGAVRSTWATGAIWGSFNAGPYTGYPGAQEQLFDSGGLAVVRGSKPLLVNATGQLFRGSAKVDNFRDADSYGPRALYNVFYAAKSSPIGQAAVTRAGGSTTRMAAFDHQRHYTFMRATDLKDMYPKSDSRGVSSWTRDVVYLRPNLFVVYDRTKTSGPGMKQWMRFHFAGVPRRAAPPSNGVTRYNIGAGTAFRGTMDSLLPVGHTETVTDTILTGTDVSRIDVKPGSAAAQNRWLTVIDAAGMPSKAAKAIRLSAADGNIFKGPVIGTLLQSSAGNYAVLAGTGEVNSVPSTPIKYHLPGTTTRSVITGLAKNTAYSVSTSTDSTGVVVTVTAGAGRMTSGAGVLEFSTNSSGVTP